MLARVRSYGINGVSGYAVMVEVDVSNGLPSYETVGLPDAAVRESKERVRAAIQNSGFEYPASRIVVNLAPADKKKEGTFYDLPIAVGVLCATGQLAQERIDDFLFLGELALDGKLRPIRGVLPMVIDAYASGLRMGILSQDNAAEAAYIGGFHAYPMQSLKQAAEFITGGADIAPSPPRAWNGRAVRYASDFALLKGQQGAKRAAEVAAAGGHNLLLTGVPGSGKTMLARSIPSILPDMTFEEALEVTKIHSVAGALPAGGGLVEERPFRAPHHSASAVSLIGGGQRALPGEISLAHYGVLFLDELLEFRKDTLESLRQPLEDGIVTIARSNAKSTYPAQFMLVAAMNPCPCGYYGSRTAACRCTPPQILRYQGRVSGPLFDRSDIQVEMTEVAYADIAAYKGGEPSADVRRRVESARRIQRERYSDDGIRFNAQLNARLLRRYCRLGAKGEALLEGAYNRFGLSVRAYSRIIKVARTIADLCGEKDITEDHIAEAIQYRNTQSKFGRDYRQGL